jgi:hypothetical protein
MANLFPFVLGWRRWPGLIFVVRVVLSWVTFYTYNVLNCKIIDKIHWNFDHDICNIWFRHLLKHGASLQPSAIWFITWIQVCRLHEFTFAVNINYMSTDWRPLKVTYSVCSKIKCVELGENFFILYQNFLYPLLVRIPVSVTWRVWSE